MCVRERERETVFNIMVKQDSLSNVYTYVWFMNNIFFEFFIFIYLFIFVKNFTVTF